MGQRKRISKIDYHGYFEFVVTQLLKTYDCKLIYPKDYTNKLSMEDGIVLQFPKANYEYKLSNFIVYSVMDSHVEQIWKRSADDIIRFIDNDFLRQIKK